MNWNHCAGIHGCGKATQMRRRGVTAGVKVRGWAYACSNARLLKTKKSLPQIQLIAGGFGGGSEEITSVPAPTQIPVDFDHAEEFVCLSLSEPKFGVEGVRLVREYFKVSGGSTLIALLR